MDREKAEKLKAMNRAFKTLRERQKENLQKFPEIKNLAEKVREIRKRQVGDAELLHRAIENLSRRGFQVHFASTSGDAVNKVLEIIGEEKLVVKSKSNLSKEISLSEELSKRGIEVVETDIGDRLIQILKEHPSHPTGPAVHLSVSGIAESLSRLFGIAIQPDAGKIVEFLRRDIENALGKSKIGITGANAITAEGAVVILHNEGNIFEVINRPEKWIILAGIDKIYDSLEDSLAAAKVQSFYATGELLPSFIEIVSGVSRTADIEKKFVALKKPKEVDLILVDNGRGKILNSEFRELLYCLGCGNCVANCPAHSVYGEDFSGGRFALYDALNGEKGALELCLSCGRCRKNCPMEIDVAGMIRKVREGSEVYNFIASHVKWLNERMKLELLKLWLRLN